MRKRLSLLGRASQAVLLVSVWVVYPGYAYGQVNGVVLTDPLVRQIQIGPPPVGAASA
jgi:hypothetical protein